MCTPITPEWRFRPVTSPLRTRAFEVQTGEFVAVVGPSGCGKSTLLRMIAGLIGPTRGRVTVGGQPAVEARRRERIGFVFQDPRLLPWRTAAQNIRLPLELERVPRPVQDGRVPDALALVGLTRADADKTSRMLSGGMRMRVSLARCADHRAQTAVVGRAVRCAGRYFAAAAQRGAGADLDAASADDGVRHAQRGRGGLSQPADPGHDAVARADRGGRRRSVRLSARCGVAGDRRICPLYGRDQRPAEGECVMNGTSRSIAARALPPIALFLFARRRLASDDLHPEHSPLPASRSGGRLRRRARQLAETGRGDGRDGGRRSLRVRGQRCVRDVDCRPLFTVGPHPPQFLSLCDFSADGADRGGGPARSFSGRGPDSAAW